jgi:hypothetical protein
MVTIGRARFITLCALLSLPPLTGSLADPAIKPAITGLISTAGFSQPNVVGSTAPSCSATNSCGLYAFPGIFGGYVVKANWKDLQPTGSSDFDTTVIDDGLQAVMNYNNAIAAANLSSPNNRQLSVRLRVWSGCRSTPGWATTLDGDPIIIQAKYAGNVVSCTTGRFWDRTSGYAAAWRDLQTKLAAKYDSNPLIREVAISACSSFSDEPFYLPWQDLADDTTSTVLPQAGYTDSDYQQCLENAVADYAPWQTSRFEFTFNPFSGLTKFADVAFSERVMRGCRQAVGQRCILSNHDLAAHPPEASAILPLYAAMRKLGPNITFQAYVVAPNDFEGTVRKGVSLGAGSIEVWQEPEAGSFEHQTAATLQSWASMFEPQ